MFGVLIGLLSPTPLPSLREVRGGNHHRPRDQEGCVQGAGAQEL